jgi:hypothetical protein
MSAELRSLGVIEAPVIVPQHTEICLAVIGNKNALVRRTGAGQYQQTVPRTGAVALTPIGVGDNAITNTGGGGRGDILLFGYNQDLTLTNVDISSPGAFAQKAIQMRGIQDGGDLANVGPYDQAGDVAINNLTITGAYGQDVIGFYRIAGFDSFTGSNNSVDVPAWSDVRRLTWSNAMGNRRISVAATVATPERTDIGDDVIHGFQPTSSPTTHCSVMR